MRNEIFYRGFFIPSLSLAAEKQGPGLNFSSENEHFKQRMRKFQERMKISCVGDCFFKREWFFVDLRALWEIQIAAISNRWRVGFEIASDLGIQGWVWEQLRASTRTCLSLPVLRKLIGDIFMSFFGWQFRVGALLNGGDLNGGYVCSLWQANDAPMTQWALILTLPTKWFEGRCVCVRGCVCVCVCGVCVCVCVCVICVARVCARSCHTNVA